jgi:hypothetical protein
VAVSITILSLIVTTGLWIGNTTASLQSSVAQSIAMAEAAAAARDRDRADLKALIAEERASTRASLAELELRVRPLENSAGVVAERLDRIYGAITRLERWIEQRSGASGDMGYERDSLP